MKRSSTTKPTFNEIFRQVEAANVGRLIRRAKLADGLAKILTGKDRQKAYRVSHEALDSLSRRRTVETNRPTGRCDGRREPPSRAEAQRWA